jgi:aminopeptidase-like protein
MEAIKSHIEESVHQKEINLGEEIYQFIAPLFPICRSITGEGVRQTLEAIQEIIPLKVYEVPTGKDVYDWQVPKEWSIHGGYIRNMKGEKIIDFQDNNLHVLNYSIPVHKTVSRVELKQHIYTLPEKPDWIPYRTSYYNEAWGFCMSYNQFKQLQDDEYEVCIDSSLDKGFLTYGEYEIRGEGADEVLISTHVCHPSLANDNLSGIGVAAFLARELKKKKLRYTYRFLFIPGTIGAITWLSINEYKTRNLRHGLVAALLGNEGGFTYKRSRMGNAEIDRAVKNVLENSGVTYKILDFSPDGYDERQFCAPGFNLSVGSLTRTRHYEYPEYHTSADNLDLVKPDALGESLSMYQQVIDLLENNFRYMNLHPMCEPQLGRRGIFESMTVSQNRQTHLALLWVLNLSDGKNTLLDISERSGMNFKLIQHAAEKLHDHKLLMRLGEREMG